MQSKTSTSKNLGDIAMDLTEVGASRIGKMVSGESKDQLIMASNGSLASAGNKAKKSRSCFCTFNKGFAINVPVIGLLDVVS